MAWDSLSASWQHRPMWKTRLADSLLLASPCISTFSANFRSRPSWGNLSVEALTHTSTRRGLLRAAARYQSAAAVYCLWLKATSPMPSDRAPVGSALPVPPASRPFRSVLEARSAASVARKHCARLLTDAPSVQLEALAAEYRNCSATSYCCRPSSTAPIIALDSWWSGLKLTMGKSVSTACSTWPAMSRSCAAVMVCCICRSVMDGAKGTTSFTGCFTPPNMPNMRDERPLSHPSPSSPMSTPSIGSTWPTASTARNRHSKSLMLDLQQQ
mmetsp:Transcript_4664/g.10474  ORF Transcript_4664/g.10474 Transcript_4664/m.10474 type:complete len:271 (-) Transcript_4664:3-815(-)